MNRSGRQTTLAGDSGLQMWLPEDFLLPMRKNDYYEEGGVKERDRGSDSRRTRTVEDYHDVGEESNRVGGGYRDLILQTGEPPTCME